MREKRTRSSGAVDPHAATNACSRGVRALVLPRFALSMIRFVPGRERPSSDMATSPSSRTTVLLAVAKRSARKAPCAAQQIYGIRLIMLGLFIQTQ